MQQSDMKSRNMALSIIALILCVVFLLGSVLFAAFARRQNDESGMRFLTATARQVQVALQDHIESDFQVLRSVAISLLEIEVQNRGEVIRYLTDVNKSNTFVRMGFARVDGIADMVDVDGVVYSGINLSGEPFFQRALHGEEAITATRESILDDGMVNYYAVPVRMSGGIIGALVGVHANCNTYALMDVPLFQDVGFHQILNRRGENIGPPVSRLPKGIGEFHAGMLTFSSPEEEARFQHALDTGAQSNFVASLRGEPQIVLLQPLHNNTWRLISVVPRKELAGYYGQITLGISILVFNALVIFALFLILQRLIMRRGQRDLEHLAYTDLLTGACNYTKFELDAQRWLATRPGQPMSIWSLDIRQFKRINDVLGYRQGDALLKEIARLLQRNTDRDMIFCRMANDAFVGMRYHKDPQALVRRFEQLVRDINHFPALKAARMEISICMGVYSFDASAPDATVNEMINRANIAKQYAKEGRGSRIMFFSQAMADTIHRESAMEQAGKAALEHGEFVFYLQPKVDIQNKCMPVSAEALCRWMHPQEGMIPPDAFIPLFERSGFIVALDRYIFEAVCKWVAEVMLPAGWRLNIAVNVSRLSFLQEDFVRRYAAIKAAYAIPDGLIELELTESIVMEDYAAHLGVMQALQAEGFSCAIDDFGAGYSSLNALKNLPMDVIKLDAAFFRDSESVERECIIVKNFVHMAKELRVVTVAEGVETPEQVRYLRSIGNDLIQGYVFSRPLPPDKFLAYCDANREGIVGMCEPG